MRPEDRNFRHALSLAVIVLLFAACTGDKYQDTVASGPSTLIGLLEQAPDLSGSWEYALTTTVDECGIEFFPPTATGALQVSQAGTEIVFTLLGPCGTAVTTGAGTVDPGGVASFTWEETFAAGEHCRLSLTTVAAGAADAAAQTLTGSFTLTVEPADDDQSCSPTFPCLLEGSFAAERCPSGDCEFVACGG